MLKKTLVQSLSIMALATTCLTPLANAQTGPGAGMMGKNGGMHSGMNNPTPMMKGNATDMRAMMADMQGQMASMTSSGDMDVDFAMMMRVHHQSAVTMAEAELQNGKDPQMRVMAKDIIYAQKKEIAVFDKFLAKRNEQGMKMGDPAMQMKK